MTITHDGKTFVTGARKPSFPKLTVIKGKSTGKDYWIKQEETSIGRSPECDLIIDDDNVSRKHARIVHISGTFFIYDNESLNGTLLNGRKIVETQVQSGDIIKLGETELKFEYEKEYVDTKTHKLDTDTSSSEEIQTVEDKIQERSPAGRLKFYTASAIILLALIFTTFYIKKQRNKPVEENPIVQHTPIQTETPYIEKSSIPSETKTQNDKGTQIPKENDPTIYFSQGLLSMMSGNYKEAIPLFKKTLEIDPEHESAKIKLEKSKELLHKTIEELYNSGVREYEILRYDRAILEWNKVFTLAKDFDEPMFNKVKDRIAEAQKMKDSIKK